MQTYVELQPKARPDYFKDFILHSPYEDVAPMFICGPSSILLYIAHIKLNGANRMADNLAKVEQAYKRFSPDNIFDYWFIDEAYARKFQEEQKLRTLATWFAGLTIFISCMGLFALVAYLGT